MVVTTFGALLLAACSSSKTEEQGTAQKETKGVSVEIVEGEFVTPPDKLNRSGVDYIALKVKIKNNTSNSLTLLPSDFVIYDEEGESVSPTSVYDPTEVFKEISHAEISKGKSNTGYLVYEIDKDITEYELRTSAYVDSKSMEKVEVNVEFSTENFEDKREETLKIAQEYISSVFLNGSSDLKPEDGTSVSHDGKNAEIISLDNKSKDKTETDKEDTDKKSAKDESDVTLGDDLEAKREEFISEIVSGIDGFTYYEPSTEEKTNLALAYVAENAKRAEVKYSLKSYLPGVVTVYVKPSVVDLSTMNMYDLVDEYLDSKGSTRFDDYEAAQRDAEKYVFDNLPSRYATASLATSKYMPSEGYALIFYEDDGAWYLASEEEGNYEYDNLVEVFSGSL